ncbi:unnamed protein product [Alternaria alternata]
MPPDVDGNVSCPPTMEIRSAVGLLYEYHKATERQSNGDRLDLIGYLRQRPDLINVKTMTFGEADQLAGLYRVATENYNDLVPDIQAGPFDITPVQQIKPENSKTSTHTDFATGEKQFTLGMLRQHQYNTSSTDKPARKIRSRKFATRGGALAEPAKVTPASSDQRKEKVEIPEGWAQELSQVVQDSVVVDQLPGDLAEDPADDPDAQFAVGRSSDDHVKRRVQQMNDKDRCPVFSCSEPALLGFRHCTRHVHFAQSRLQYPPEDSEWMKQLQFLREWVAGTQKGVGYIWGLDVEFDVLNFATPIAFTIAIKDFTTGIDILNTKVGYGGQSADDLLGLYHEICPQDFRLHKRTELGFRKAFQRYYASGRAYGMRFSEMRAAILEAGFDPRTHAVISYSTNLDLQVFWKALSGIDEPFVAPTVRENFQLRNGLNYYTCLQTVNIQHVVKNMLKKSPREGCTLTGIYRVLFGIEDVQAHEAPADTLMLLDIIRLVAAFESSSH